MDRLRQAARLVGTIDFTAGWLIIHRQPAHPIGARIVVAASTAVRVISHGAAKVETLTLGSSQNAAHILVAIGKDVTLGKLAKGSGFAKGIALDYFDESKGQTPPETDLTGTTAKLGPIPTDFLSSEIVSVKTAGGTQVIKLGNATASASTG